MQKFSPDHPVFSFLLKTNPGLMAKPAEKGRFYMAIFAIFGVFLNEIRYI